MTAAFEAGASRSAKSGDNHAPTAAPKYRYIGKPMPVIEDRRFVRGRGRYINDVDLPGMLHLGVASAPVAHARLISVNVEAARKAPGVVAVLTGADVAQRMGSIPQNFDYQRGDGAKLPAILWYPLAVDKIRFAGEWVAAVVATSRAVAEDAAELIEIEYEALPPVLDPEAAMRPGSPLLHEQLGSNVVWNETWTWGDVDAAFAQAAHVFEYQFRWHRNSGVPLETFGAVAAVDRSGTLDVWASHQMPHMQEELVQVLRLPTARVHQDLDVGGAFGAKQTRKQIFLTAIAAMVAGAPVKFIEDRIENMQAGDAHGPDRRYRVKLAVTPEGIVEALDVHLIEDLGAYSGRGPLAITKPIGAAVGPYRIKNVRYGGYGVLTNKTNQVPFRGAGMAVHNFALERAMDQAARDLGLDPIEIRLRNYIERDEFPYRNPIGTVYDSGNFRGAARLALEKADIGALRAEQAAARRDGRLIGIGFAGGLEPSGAPTDPETARLQIDPRGHVVVTIGFQSSGQSHESMITQIVCEQLGVEPAHVTVQRGDGRSGIVGGATTGSRMTLLLGGAVHGVSEKVRNKLKSITAHLLETATEDIDVDGTRYFVVGARDLGFELKDLVNIAYNKRILLPAGMEAGVVEDAVFSLNVPRRPDGGSTFPSYGFDVHIPVVEIDRETFTVKFLRYVVVHDCGTVINPLVIDGFVYGGICHGIGGALYEQFVYDDQGMLIAATLSDYVCPTASEVPHMELYEQVTPSPTHPFGAKGSAEGSYMTAPAAIASAVEDALAPLGVRVGEVPITPDFLFKAMTSAKRA
ncbi:MAG: xanthine dehydrogenase family protein molybdopterin-binding subunit [Casimicrobiaceae bacterium]